jgi:hypothetical protein
MVKFFFNILLNFIFTVTYSNSFREIGYFNLADSEISKIICENIKKLPCINFLILESGQYISSTTSISNEIKFSSDVLTSVISTVGSPVNIFSYYKNQNKI